MSTDTPAAAKAYYRALERRRHMMILANRYLAAGKPAMLKDLELPRQEVKRVTEAGGYTSAELEQMRALLRYYRNKAKRKLWPIRAEA